MLCPRRTTLNGRNGRVEASTSPSAPLPRSGFVLRPAPAATASPIAAVQSTARRSQKLPIVHMPTWAVRSTGIGILVSFPLGGKNGRCCQKRRTVSGRLGDSKWVKSISQDEQTALRQLTPQSWKGLSIRAIWDERATALYGLHLDLGAVRSGTLAQV